MRRPWLLAAGLVLLGAVAGCCHHKGSCRGGCESCGCCGGCGDCCQAPCDCGHDCGYTAGCGCSPGHAPAGPPGALLTPTPSIPAPAPTDFGTGWGSPAGPAAETLRVMPKLVEPPMSQGTSGGKR